MNNLHRELAPISDAAWSQIEEETTRTFKRYLAGRRVVDVQGPGGVAALRRRHRPLAHRRGAGGRHPGATARGQAAGRAPGAVRARPPADRRRRARRRRFRLAARQGCRAAICLRRGPRDLRRLCRRRHSGHPRGHQQSDDAASGRRARTIPTPSPRRSASCVSSASMVPIPCCWAPTPTRRSSETSDHGYPVLEHIKRLVDGRDHLGAGDRRRLRAHHPRRRLRPAYRPGCLDRLSEP